MTSAQEYLSELERIGWFQNLPSDACHAIEHHVKEAEVNDQSFSPWPELYYYTPLNILIGEHLIEKVLIYYITASYGVFRPKNIQVDETLLKTQAGDIVSVRLSFTFNDREYFDDIPLTYPERLDQAFFDLINRAMHEQTNGLCFTEVDEEYGTIALANRKAVDKAKEISLIPDYQHFWRKLPPKEEIDSQQVEQWQIIPAVGTRQFYRDNSSITLSELRIKESGYEKNYGEEGFLSGIIKFFEHINEPEGIRFGYNGSTLNDVSRTCSYLEFDGHFLEVYSYNSDGADEEEIRFDAEVIFYSRYTMSGEETDTVYYSENAVAWANSLLQYLGIKQGGESFQRFCNYDLRLPVGWIQRIFYDEKPSLVKHEVNRQASIAGKNQTEEGRPTSKTQPEKIEPQVREPLTKVIGSENVKLQEYWSQLQEIDWFKLMSETQKKEIWLNLKHNADHGESFSPWLKGCRVAERKNHIGDYTSLLLQAAQASNSQFNPKNIIEKRDCPLVQETSQLSFETTTETVTIDVPFDANFLDVLNRKLKITHNGLGFMLLGNREEYIYPFNQFAMDKALEVGVTIGYQVNSKHLNSNLAQGSNKIEKEEKPNLLNQLKTTGNYFNNVLQQHVQSVEIQLDSLKFKDKKGFAHELLFGQNGSIHNDIDITAAYLSFKEGVLTCYSRDSDHVSKAEVQFNGMLIYESYFTSEDDRSEYFYSSEASKWANDLLRVINLDMEQGYENFEILLNELQLGLLASYAQYLFNDPSATPKTPVPALRIKLPKAHFEPTVKTVRSMDGQLDIPIHQLSFENTEKEKMTVSYGTVYKEIDHVFHDRGQLVFKEKCLEFKKELRYQSKETGFRHLEEFYFNGSLLAKVLQEDAFNDQRTVESLNELNAWIADLMKSMGLGEDLTSFIKVLNEDFGWGTELLKEVILPDADLDLWQLFKQRASHQKAVKSHKSSQEGIELWLDSLTLDSAIAAGKANEILFGTQIAENDCKTVYSMISYDGHEAESYVEYGSQKLYFDQTLIYTRLKDGNHKQWEIHHSPKAIAWVNQLLSLVQLAKHPDSLCHLPYVLGINSDVFDKLYCGSAQLNQFISYHYFK